METQAALVGADGAAHLHTEAPVDLHPAGIVDPGHAEQDCALRLDDALDDAGFQIARIGFEEGPQAAQHLFHGLVELGLIRVALLEALQKNVDGWRHGAHQNCFL